MAAPLVRPRFPLSCKASFDTMKSTPLGYLFTFLAFSVFAIQDGLSKHLAPPIRRCRWPWSAIGPSLPLPSFCDAFQRWPARRSQYKATFPAESFAAFSCSRRFWCRSSPLPRWGLPRARRSFAAGPIFVALLSMPILGEKVGWRRWTAILFGLVGVVIMLAPTGDSFNAYIWLPLICAVMGAVYGIATRLVSRDDQPSTSFFYLANRRFHRVEPAGALFLDAVHACGLGADDRALLHGHHRPSLADQGL